MKTNSHSRRKFLGGLGAAAAMSVVGASSLRVFSGVGPQSADPDFHAPNMGMPIIAQCRLSQAQMRAIGPRPIAGITRSRAAKVNLRRPSPI